MRGYRYTTQGPAQVQARQAHAGLLRYLGSPQRRVVSDLPQMWSPHPGAARNPFAYISNDYCLNETLIRRLFTPLYPEYRRFALGVFWVLVLDAYVSWEAPTAWGEIEPIHDWIQQIVVEGDPARPLRMPVALEPLHDLLASSAATQLQAGDAARIILGVGGWLMSRDQTPARAGPQGPALGPQRVRWVCDLLREWWDRTTSRLAFVGAVKIRRWPPPKGVRGLTNYLYRMGANVEDERGLRLIWTDMIANQETARRTISRLIKLVDGPLAGWRDNPVVVWMTEFGHRLLEMNPFRISPEEIEGVRVLRREYEADVTVAGLKDIPQVLEHALNAMYFTWLPFEVSHVYPAGSRGAATALDQLLNVLHPVGDPLAAGRITGSTLNAASWTQSPWKEVVKDWWITVWNQIVAIDPQAVLG